jgi:hypothetical protein
MRLNTALLKVGHDVKVRFPDGYQEAPLAYDAVWAVALGNFLSLTSSTQWLFKLTSTSLAIRTRYILIENLLQFRHVPLTAIRHFQFAKNVNETFVQYSTAIKFRYYFMILYLFSVSVYLFYNFVFFSFSVVTFAQFAPQVWHERSDSLHLHVFESIFQFVACFGRCYLSLCHPP